MAYYVMTCEGVFPSAAMKGGPKLGDPPWLHGRIVKNIPIPLTYTLDPDRPGNLVAMYEGMKYPIMRDDLIEALQAVGVNNLQLFEAIIRDPVTGREYSNYKAFNIVGVVSAADMEKSVLMGTSDSKMIDADFDSLVIDEKRAAPFRLFRLAENVSAIIVDDVVKKEVECRGIPGMVFYDPRDWSG
ncbi:MAG: DUF1629 domain-containing protein [bacterium]